MIGDFFRKLLGKQDREELQQIGKEEHFTTELGPARGGLLNRDDLPVASVVKERLPKSAFTKSGPGVLREVRYQLSNMTTEQRLIARQRKWDRGLVRPDGTLGPA